jgi:hypothetical protein
MALGMQSVATTSSGAANSQIYGDFSLNASAFRLDISVNGNSSVNKTQGQFDLNISGSGSDKKNTVSGKLGLDAKLDWSGTGGVTVPSLNSINSRVVQAPPRSISPSGSIWTARKFISPETALDFRRQYHGPVEQSSPGPGLHR